MVTVLTMSWLTPYPPATTALTGVKVVCTELMAVIARKKQMRLTQRQED